MKKKRNRQCRLGGSMPKFLLKMKLLTYLMLVATASVTANSYSQQTKFSMEFESVTVRQIFKEIEERSEFILLYSRESVNVDRKVTVSVTNENVNSLLDQVFKGTNNYYEIYDRQITIISKDTQIPASAKEIKTNLPAEKKITGKVTDSSGGPLPGVAIAVKGTNLGTTTNSDGNYTITNVPTDAILMFSYIGMKSKEVSTTGKTEIHIVLEEDAIGIEEVVAVGYGTQKKISLVGSQSTVKPIELQLPVRNLSNSLGGRLSGVVSVQRSGEPGGDNAEIYIRGISTFSSSLSKPLVLVDGVPRSFSDVDPEDIESFAILKDASATAVYGVRGANGVILIKTKGGKEGKPSFNLRYNEGITRFTKVPEFADGVTYMELSNEALTTRGSSPRYSDEAIEATRAQTDPYLYPNIDWFDELFNKWGATRRMNLNINGGSSLVNYYVATSYYDEKGLYKTDALANYDSQVRFKRYNLTSNITVEPSQTTTVKLGIQGYLANVNYPGTNSSDIFEKAFFVTPVLHPIQYEDGRIADATASSVQNPYALLTRTGYANQWKNQLFSNLRVTQELDFLVKGLSATAMLSFDAYNYVSLRRTKVPDTWLANGRDADGNLILQLTRMGTEFLDYSRSNSGSRSLYSELSLNYNRTFNDHDVSGMVLFNQSDEINTLASDLESSLPYRFQGMSGRATYSYKNKYFTEFNFGYNGSENFLPEKRFGFFPSVGLGWLISGENFFAPIKGIIQMAKLRFSHGIVGNSNIGGRRFAYLNTIASTAGYTFGRSYEKDYSGFDIGEYAVDVTWETSTKTNLGLDLKMFKDAMSLQVDIFKETRDGIFLRRSSLPGYLGLRNNPYGNVGIIDNRGFDGSATYFGKIGNDFSIQLLGNFTFSRNEVVEDDKPDPIYPWLATKGRKVGQRFGYIALGFFESEEEIANSPLQSGDVRPGDLKFKDMNGDGMINSYDNAPIGYGSVPEIVYGFGFTLGYKALTLSTLFQGVGNMDIWLNGEGLVPFQQGLSRGNTFKNITDRWTIENPNPEAFYPRLGAGTINDNYTRSSWWIQSGRYLRLKSLQLNYKLPQQLVSKLKLKNADVFFSGVNLLTISPFKLWDAELGDGSDGYPGGARYPNVATYSIGFNLNF